MRIWGIHPLFLCSKHLTGQHSEIHKHLPSLYRGISIDGRMKPIIQIELWSLQRIHDECANYLNHKSPLEVDEYLLWKNYPQYYYEKIDLNYNVRDLCDRCPECKKKIEKAIKNGLPIKIF